jgi:hypothetical protein
MNSVFLVEASKQANLEDLVEANVLRPPENQLFVIVKFEELELSALAAVCEHRFGTSRIADLLRGGKDPIAVAAESFRWTPESLRMSRGTNDQQHFWRCAVMALLQTISMKLAPQNACAILKSQYDLELSPSEAGRRQSQLVEIYPELALYIADDTIERVATHLQIDPEHVRDELGESLSGPELRRVLIHQGPSRETQVQELCARSSLMRRFIWSAPRPMECVLMRHFATPTGRIRAPAHYSEEVAEYLDLADHALKAASYAVAAEGHSGVHFLMGETMRDLKLIRNPSQAELIAGIVGKLANGKPARTAAVAKAAGMKRMTAYGNLVRARDQGLIEQFGYAGWRPTKPR